MDIGVGRDEVETCRGGKKMWLATCDIGGAVTGSSGCSVFLQNDRRIHNEGWCETGRY